MRFRLVPTVAELDNILRKQGYLALSVPDGSDPCFFVFPLKGEYEKSNRWAREGEYMDNNLSLALAYLEKLPSAQSGAGGHNATLRAALVTRQFNLSAPESWDAMVWYNRNRCSPEWSERELRHKLASVADVTIKKKLGQRNQSAHRLRAFVAPAKPAPRPMDTRPIRQRSEQEEELWWTRWCLGHSTTLEALDAMVGND